MLLQYGRTTAPSTWRHDANIRLLWLSRTSRSSSSSSSGDSSGRTSRSSVVVVSAAMEMDFNLARNEGLRRQENVEGPFFVDRTCIDCDTCRWMAPATFNRVGRQSAVVAQPGDRAGRVQALRALLSCPTFSIHVTNRFPDELREAQEGLPARVPGVISVAEAEAEERGYGTAAVTAASTEGVYYTGWAAVSSLAGCAYLVVRPGGNILVDAPRYNPVLARRIEALGGVRFMFMTHRDDVGGHAEWARNFRATRILHELEVREEQATDKVEIQLSGEGPWVLNRNGDVVPVQAAAVAATATGAADGGGGGGDTAMDNSTEVTFIFTPGHTEGHVCMYYAPYKALFTGDHLCSALGAVEGAPQDELYIFTTYNWFSIPEQLRSVHKLLQYDWLHVLPAHGRRAHLGDAAARLAAVSDLLLQHGDALGGCGGSGGTAVGKAAAAVVQPSST